MYSVKCILQDLYLICYKEYISTVLEELLCLAVIVIISTNSFLFSWLQVPLGLPFKNENINDEMIDILDTIHSKITVDESGEQTTEVLDQICKGRRRFFVWQFDTGTMCSKMNVTNNINAKTKNVLDNFNDCKDFVELETDAYIVAAAMKHFNMKSLEDQVVPQLVHKGTKETRRVWIHNQAKEILEKFVMTRQSAECMEIVETVTEANQRKVFFCSACGKRYSGEKARDNHERKQHPESSMASEIELENSSASSTPPSEDYVYNHACVRLSFGMLIQNFNDAVREGYGLRILWCWKFLLLSYKANKHHKYAFAALHLIAKTISLLTLQQAKRLVWNWTVNNRGGEGRNIH